MHRDASSEEQGYAKTFICFGLCFLVIVCMDCEDVLVGFGSSIRTESQETSREKRVSKFSFEFEVNCGTEIT